MNEACELCFLSIFYYHHPKEMTGLSRRVDLVSSEMERTGDFTMSSSEKPYRILVADDQPAVLDALKLLLRSEGFEVDLVRSPQVVLESIALHEYDALLLDLNYARDTTSGREGIELLQRIREVDSQIAVIVISAWGTINLAVEAMRQGARDF